MSDPFAEGYRVVQKAHGVVVFGLVPLSDFPGLVVNWKARGLDLLDMSVASALGAALCVTSCEGSVAWRREIEAEATRIGRNDRELVWLLGCDTGLSSLCIMAALGTSRETQGRAARMMGENRRPPDDADSFGRCVRLLDLFPEWRARLGEVAKITPSWAAYIARWTEIEAVYREELSAGSFPRTDSLLETLTARSEG